MTAPVKALDTEWDPDEININSLYRFNPYVSPHKVFFDTCNSIEFVEPMNNVKTFSSTSTFLLLKVIMNPFSKNDPVPRFLIFWNLEKKVFVRLRLSQFRYHLKELK